MKMWVATRLTENGTMEINGVFADRDAAIAISQAEGCCITAMTEGVDYRAERTFEMACFPDFVPQMVTA